MKIEVNKEIVALLAVVFVSFLVFLSFLSKNESKAFIPSLSLTVTLAPFVLKKLSNSDFLFCVAKIFKYFDIHKCI
jgi:hypothetical protein